MNGRFGYGRDFGADLFLCSEWVSWKQNNAGHGLKSRIAIRVAPFCSAAISRLPQWIIKANWNYILPLKDMERHTVADVFKRVSYSHFRHRLLMLGSVEIECKRAGNMGHYLDPWSVSEYQRVTSDFNRTFRSIGSISHLTKLILHDRELSMIYPQRSNADYAQADLTPHRGFFNPMNLTRKVFGFFGGLVGIGLASFAHCALLYRGWRWSDRKWLIIGIPGWGLAAVAIWHGASLLLNP